MKITNHIWVASYPRSGNTFLRTILWHCFGLRSASIYPNDLGGNKELEEYVGHIEHSADMGTQLQDQGVPLIKTHEHARDSKPAIYIIRDGKAACFSLWEFYKGAIPLEAVITGKHRFGTWAAHVNAWDPLNRPDTLLLKYEQLINDLPTALHNISEFLNKEILTTSIPDRSSIAGIDGRWVKQKQKNTSTFSKTDLQRFMDINQTTLNNFDYN